MNMYTVSAYCHNKLLARAEIVELSPSRAIEAFKTAHGSFCSDTVIAAQETEFLLAPGAVTYIPEQPKLSVYLVTGKLAFDNEIKTRVITASTSHNAIVAFREVYKSEYPYTYINVRKPGPA